MTINPLPIDSSRSTLFTFYVYQPAADTLIPLDHDLLNGSTTANVNVYTSADGIAWGSALSAGVAIGGNGWYFSDGDKDIPYTTSLGISVFKGIRIGLGAAPASKWVKVVYKAIGDYVEPADLWTPSQRWMTSAETGTIGQYKVVATKQGDAADTIRLWDKTSTTMEIVGVTVQPESVGRPNGMLVPVQSEGLLAMGSGLTIGKKVWATSSGGITQDESTFAATDRKIVIGVAVSSTQVELQIGSGGEASSSSKDTSNLVQNPLNAANTNGWSRSSGSLSWDTTYNLAGSGAMLASAFSTGQTIDGLLVTPVDGTKGGQSWQIDIGYRLDSNTFADGELTAVLYDGTNEIPGGNIPIVTGQTNTTSVLVFPSTTLTNLKVRIKAGGTGKSANLRLGNIKVAPQQILSVPALSGWIPYTPTVTNGPTLSANSGFYWRREGDSMRIKGRIASSAAGPAAGLSVSIPSGYTIDQSKLSPVLSNGLGENAIGAAGWYTGTQETYLGLAVNSSTTIYFIKSLANTQLAGSELPSGAGAAFDILLPITQWSNTIQVSAEANRYFSWNGSATVEDLGGSPVPNVASTTGQTTHAITLPAGVAAEEVEIELYDGNQKRWSVLQGDMPFCIQNTYAYGLQKAWTGPNQITLYFGNGGYQTTGAVYGTVSSSTWAGLYAVGFKYRVRVKRGGSLAEVPPVVRAEYYNNAATTSLAATNFQSKTEDTHNAVTAGANWKFTAPVNGVYLVEATIVASGSDTNMQLFKNDSIYRNIGAARVGAFSPVQGTIRLKAGDYIDVRPQGVSLPANGATVITITRIGS